MSTSIPSGAFVMAGSGKTLNMAEYYKILSSDFPAFLSKYISLPILQRLAGVGLLCGTDWTPLYHNRFFYSRLDHSVGVALVLWHFTHDKTQTIAGLLHDVSTPAFSHVSDFRNGDVLKQESTESANRAMIDSDEALNRLLVQDGISAGQVDDYRQYPVADNELPHLSADRLEYMFPSGMALDGSWDLPSAKKAYSDLVLCVNEKGEPEPGFTAEDCAADYCERCSDVGLILQHNENKLSLQLLAEILSRAVRCSIIREKDFFAKSEKQLIDRFEECAVAPRNGDELEFAKYFRTFRTMKSIEHTEQPLKDCFCVSLNVKKRYIDPLVVTGKRDGMLYRAARASAVSKRAEAAVRSFLAFSDSKYGCVPFVKI